MDLGTRGTLPHASTSRNSHAPRGQSRASLADASTLRYRYVHKLIGVCEAAGTDGCS